MQDRNARCLAAEPWGSAIGGRSQALPEAQYNLGVLLNEGTTGLEKNLTEAARYRRLSSEQSFAPAQFKFGQCLRDGIGGGKNLEEAERFLKLAAEQGYPD